MGWVGVRFGGRVKTRMEDGLGESMGLGWWGLKFGVLIGLYWEEKFHGWFG